MAASGDILTKGRKCPSCGYYEWVRYKGKTETDYVGEQALEYWCVRCQIYFIVEENQDG